MYPSDEVLLDFDKKNLGNYRPERARQALNEHGDLYRNHLVIAKFLDFWIGNLEQNQAREHKDFIRGLTEVRAHLRQADFVPGAGMYDREVERLTREELDAPDA
jgi:hypothetical protein